MLKRILLAEDDPNDLELTLRALGMSNLANQIDVVSDGQEALDYLYRQGAYANRGADTPAVILLDIKMPRITGLEVLRRLKADADLRTTPVVILTSSREERDLIESYDLGVNAYVVKPVDFSDFFEAVQQLGLFWALVNQPPPTRENR
jgi:CheY-like chemotaxis protein